MRQEDFKKLKEGDKLLCIKGNDHFSKGDVYTVHKGGSVLVVYCDDIAQHWVEALKPEMFKQVEEK